MTTQYSLDGHNVVVTTHTTTDLRTINAQNAFRNVKSGLWDDRMFSIWAEFVSAPPFDEFIEGEVIAVRDHLHAPWCIRVFVGRTRGGDVRASDTTGETSVWRFSRSINQAEVEVDDFAEVMEDWKEE